MNLKVNEGHEMEGGHELQYQKNVQQSSFLKEFLFK